jgi:hypothetical protein
MDRLAPIPRRTMGTAIERLAEKVALAIQVKAYLKRSPSGHIEPVVAHERTGQPAAPPGITPLKPLGPPPPGAVAPAPTPAPAPARRAPEPRAAPSTKTAASFDQEPVERLKGLSGAWDEWNASKPWNQLSSQLSDPRLMVVGQREGIRSAAGAALGNVAGTWQGDHIRIGGQAWDEAEPDTRKFLLGHEASHAAAADILANVPHDERQAMLEPFKSTSGGYSEGALHVKDDMFARTPEEMLADTGATILTYGPDVLKQRYENEKKYDIGATPPDPRLVKLFSTVAASLRRVGLLSDETRFSNVKLARTYVGPYLRPGDEGIERVRGYWRRYLGLPEPPPAPVPTKERAHLLATSIPKPATAADVRSMMKKYHVPQSSWQASGRVAGWGSHKAGFEVEEDRYPPDPSEYDLDERVPESWNLGSTRRYYEAGGRIYKLEPTKYKASGEMGVRDKEIKGKPTGTVRLRWSGGSYSEQVAEERYQFHSKKLLDGLQQEGFVFTQDGKNFTITGKGPKPKAEPPPERAHLLATSTPGKNRFNPKQALKYAATWEELPDTVYHVAPARLHDAIVKEGLQPKGHAWNFALSEMDREKGGHWDSATQTYVGAGSDSFGWRPEAAYVFADPEIAVQFKEEYATRHGEEMEVFAVDSLALLRLPPDQRPDLIKDPETIQQTRIEEREEPEVEPATPDEIFDRLRDEDYGEGEHDYRQWAISQVPPEFVRPAATYELKEREDWDEDDWTEYQEDHPEEFEDEESHPLLTKVPEVPPIPNPKGYPSPRGPVHGLVYHGTSRADIGWKTLKYGVFWTTNSKEDAAFYKQSDEGFVVELELDLKNAANEIDLAEAVKAVGARPEEIDENSPYESVDQNPNDYIYVPRVREELQRRGFDGYRGWDVMTNYEIQAFVPFNPDASLDSRRVVPDQEVYPEEEGASPLLTTTELHRLIATNATEDDLRKPLQPYTVTQSQSENGFWQYLEARDDRGFLVAEMSWTRPDPEDDHFMVDSIRVDEGHRGKGLAVGLIAEAHARTGYKIDHGSFASPEGAQLGFFMASHYPEWNRVWLGEDAKGNLRYWTPGEPISLKDSTFDPMPWEVRQRGLQMAKRGASIEKLPSQTPRSWAKLSRVRLARVYVPRHPRFKAGEIEDVDPYSYVRQGRAVAAQRATRGLTRGGGFSVSRNGHEPDGGFMVAYSGDEEVFDASTVGTQTIGEYMSRHEADLNKPGSYLGGWVDHETGKVYLDVSENVESVDEAKRIGKDRKQIAIYDLDSDKEIRLARGHESHTLVFLPKDDPAEAARLLREVIDGRSS